MWIESKFAFIYIQLKYKKKSHTFALVVFLAKHLVRFVFLYQFILQNIAKIHGIVIRNSMIYKNNSCVGLTE